MPLKPPRLLAQKVQRLQGVGQARWATGVLEFEKGGSQG